MSVLVLGFVGSPLSISNFPNPIFNSEQFPITGIAFAQEENDNGEDGTNGNDELESASTSQTKAAGKVKPEDKGKPEGKGKPEDKGKPSEKLSLEGDKGKLEDKGKPEGKGKPEDKAARLADKLQRKEAKLAQSIEDRQAKGIQKSKEIKQQLLQKIDQLKPNQKGLLKKVESGEYLGPTLGGDSYTGTYTLDFNMDIVTATAISDSTHTETVIGQITMENVVTRSNNLKLEVIGCNLDVGDDDFYCAFGKARAISSEGSEVKDSMVIIGFMQDSNDPEKRGTIKIFLNSDTSLDTVTSGDINVNIVSPQSRIGHQWFIGGDATITVSGYTVHETSSIVSSDEVEPEVEVPEVEESEVEVPEVEEPEAEVEEVEVPEVEEVEEPEVEVAEVEEP